MTDPTASTPQFTKGEHVLCFSTGSLEPIILTVVVVRQTITGVTVRRVLGNGELDYHTRNYSPRHLFRTRQELLASTESLSSDSRYRCRDVEIHEARQALEQAQARYNRVVADWRDFERELHPSPLTGGGLIYYPPDPARDYLHNDRFEEHMRDEKEKAVHAALSAFEEAP